MTRPAATASAPQPRMLLSVNEVATELGCGRDTVYRLLTTGQLRSITVGGRLRRIRSEDLRAYIDSRATSWSAASTDIA